MPSQILARRLQQGGGASAVEIARYACYVGHTREIESSRLRSFHVQAGLPVKQSPTDTMPVIPPPKVLLVQTAPRNAMADGQLRRIKASEAGGASADRPLTDLLTKQGPGFAAQPIVPGTCNFEAFPPESDIDAKRYVL